MIKTEAESIFYIKVTQLEQNTAQYRYEIIFVLDALPTDGMNVVPTDEMEGQTSEKDKTEENKFPDSEEASAPSAKRVLFGTSAKPVNAVIANVSTEKTNTSPSSKTHQVTTKRKLD